MKKNLEKTLVEMFGDPIDPKFGTKIGQVPGIRTVGAVGVRDMGMNDDLGGICQDCGMMSIDGNCGCKDTTIKPNCDRMAERYNTLNRY